MQSASPAPSPRRQRSRAAIVAATRRVLRRHGHAAMTVELILAEAGVSRATFYSHFTDRHDAMQALMGEMWQRSEDVYARFAALPVVSRETVRAWLSWVEARWEEHYEEIAVLLRDQPRELATDAGPHMARFVATLIGDGRHWACARAVAECRAHLLIAQLERVMLELRRGDWRIDREAAIDELVTFWLEAVTRP